MKFRLIVSILFILVVVGVKFFFADSEENALQESTPTVNYESSAPQQSTTEPQNSGSVSFHGI